MIKQSKAIFILLATVALLLGSCNNTLGNLQVKNGTFVIPKTFNIKSNTVEVNGKWLFVPNKLKTSIDSVNKEKILTVQVPQKWNKEEFGVKDYLACGTYFLTIKIPKEFKRVKWSLRINHIATNYKVFNNNKFIQSLGNVSCSSASSLAKMEQDFVGLTPKNGVIKLAIQVSNFHYRETGIIKPLIFGPTRNIKLLYRSKIFIDITIFGLVLIMGLYHIGLFFGRREDLGSLYFGIFCVLASIRILVTNTLFITVALPALSFFGVLLIEYISFYYMIPVFLGYLIYVFNFQENFHHRMLKIHLAFATVFSIHNLFVSSYMASVVVLFYNINLFVGVIHVMYLWLRALKLKKNGSLESIIGGYILLIFICIDMSVTFHILPIPYIFSIGFALFIFAQSYTISKIFAITFVALKNLSQRLTTTNSAYAKFVPKEFLGLLGKDDITQISLGDQVGKEMTILFTDIRSFTSLSETMTPKENFNFLNSYLKRMGPIVTSNHGFIDKYIGDAIMALFPRSAEDALITAIQMQEELIRYNKHRKNNNYKAIATGIGVHTGRLMLGTIGVEDRMDGTVVSDAVNLSSRIESLTKVYGVPILISEPTLKEIKDPSKYHIRMLDRVKVKGKQKKVTVYEVYDALDQELREKQNANLVEFEEGVALYIEEKFEKALAKFEAVTKKNNNDNAALMYIIKCRDLLSNKRNIDPK